MNDLYKKFQALSSPVQIIIFAIIIFIVYRVYTNQKLKAKARRREQESESERVFLENELGQSLSYNRPKYSGWANELEKAIEGSGTKEEVITRIFGYMKNDLDVLELYSAFGLRLSSYSWFGSPSDLFDWIKSDLSSEDIKSINLILKSKGINKTIQ